MTPDEFAERMKRIAESPAEFAERMKRIEYKGTLYIDQEDTHRAADDLMCELLCDLGYKKGIEIFKDMPKWYA